MSKESHKNDLLEMYRLMALTRRFEEKACVWNQRGETLEIPHSSIGQEAIGVGVCYGLRNDDWIMPSLRTRGAFFAKGVRLKDVVATMCGKKNGYSAGHETSHHAGIPKLGILVGSGVVGASIAVAVGAAMGIWYQGSDAVVVDFFGDGASNRGDFHESLNLAGVYSLPVVFVCENNLYAMSVPHERQMAIDDIAVRAQSYGFPGLVVDGNDILAVHEVAGEAISRARKGQGPTLIECKTYRFRPHCEIPSMELEPWRSEEEVKAWKKRDPLILFEHQLLKDKILTTQGRKEMYAQIDSSLDEALEYAKGSPDPLPEEAADGIYFKPDKSISGD